MIYEEYQGMTTYEILEREQSHYGQQTAFSYMGLDRHIRTVTYEKFFEDVRRAAGYLDRRSMKGKTIAISVRNAYEQYVCMYAAASMGAVAFMMNFDLSLEDLEYALEQSKPALLIYDEEDAWYANEHWNGESVCCTSVDAGECVADWLASDGELYTYDGSFSPEQPALMLMTSGSTSRSKLVLLKHYAFYPYIAEFWIGKIMQFFPIYHVAAIIVVSTGMGNGAHICLSSMKNGLRDIEWFHPNNITAVPMFLYEVVKRIRQGNEGYEYVDTMCGGGAPLSQETIDYLNGKGIFSTSIYGITEVGIVVNPVLGKYRYGSVGEPGSWLKLEIAPNGEVLIQADGVMAGYVGDPEGTRKAIQDGWYHTGDVGYLDDDGFLFLTGRINNIILFSNGENVSPEAIEAKLILCEDIDEVLVYGENEEISAKLWCGEDAEEEKRDRVRNYVERYNKEVPMFQRVKTLHFCEEPLEKTASGKIKR